MLEQVGHPYAIVAGKIAFFAGIGIAAIGKIVGSFSYETYDDYYSHDILNPTYIRRRRVTSLGDPKNQIFIIVDEQYTYYDSVRPDYLS